MTARKWMSVLTAAMVALMPFGAVAETVVTYPQLPAAATRPPISPLDTLSPSDQSTAKKMAEVYSRHLYNTYCFESNKLQLVAKGANKKPPKTSEQLQKSCDCMADFLLSRHSAHELSEYITKNHGVRAPRPPPQSKAPKVVISEADMKMAVDWRDPVAIKKCGINAQ